MPTMSYIARLQQDVRFIDGLNTCINCGICTAICPAALVHHYDPRQIVDVVQHGNEDDIKQLLKSNTIWFCGECLSCKTRCPRGNTPGYIIQALRALSIESGLFVESEQGRKQLAIKRTVGDHILKYGYSVFIDEIDTVMYPEQGPIWDWYKKNKQDILQRLQAINGQQQSCSLRQISTDDLDDLQRIFNETGATDRFKIIESLSAYKAAEMGMNYNSYFSYVYNKKTD